MTPEERSRAAHPSSGEFFQTVNTALIDQLGASFRDAADLLHINLFDPKIARAVAFVADSILQSGMVHEPDHERVATAQYLSAMAWREVVGA